MSDLFEFYIDGAWVKPHGETVETVVNPSTEQVVARIILGDAQDADRAVSAARQAFPAYAGSSLEARIDLLHSIIEVYKGYSEALIEAVHLEMGAPLSLARSAHVPAGLGHLVQALEVLREYRFERRLGNTLVVREPIGVSALITPWNWPLNQLTCKLAPALAVGCTLVLKPSERAPLSAHILAQILHEAGVPKGVFNLVHGDGPGVGAALARHADVDMVSFTGSTRAGIAVARMAADTVKRVSQELGGKSANILLDDADLPSAVRHGVLGCIRNSGQSCNAPTRLLVPRVQQQAVIDIARQVLDQVCFDDSEPTSAIGPVANAMQFERVQAMIAQAIAEGSRLVAGGPGRPHGIERGYYVQPTIFADVTPDMLVAREEIFGPVLAIMPYDSEAEAIAIANDSPYGLSGYVTSASLERSRQVARQLRTGMVHLNGARADQAAPFGGYKQSGNGREWGESGFDEYLESKSLFGY
ncbi:aldehyde dehydrogenase family protein [Pseudomonas versuta]|uniref:Aldehyde dehydrogenase family protein n=1 Tax=Pseudomonas versuta TaxID=1788301 RepID=A0ABX3E9W6_9PSED|nr:aldehyde dehydrogenase family protein [Pseudomonas versuta]ALE88210.1 aldehyde dehydrogenase [Pseudomonas versuta]OKA22132.1 aldehyde dehydrogenase family protein [Pseudomonas versuta]